MRGRFAPSPTGPLHVGNLRTALVSWLQVRAAGPGAAWLVRMEDLDRVTASRDHEAAQLASLAVLGMEPDEPVVRQSERFDLYRDAIQTFRAVGRVYECFCTRSEIHDEIERAAHAPHGDRPDGAYPGTCRSLSAQQCRRYETDGRRPALRLRTDSERFTITDLVAGSYTGEVDDVVLQRNDGVPAYNLAVVVDDAAQDVTHVVRGDDLLASTPRQRLLQELLGLPKPTYAHLPLVLGDDGTRLAKRHGAVTLEAVMAAGMSASAVLTTLAESVGWDGTPDSFNIEALPRQPWMWHDPTISS